jgi:crossover junction endodeoxyribonuclease RuvC
MKVLGIDPGSHITGYGIVFSENQIPHYLAHGIIKTPKKEPLFNRLGLIFKEISRIIEVYQPDILGIEKVFFAKNPHSALLLGHARGVAMLPGILKGINIHEYSALEIKQAVAGYGRADKEQVRTMVQRLLAVKGDLTYDGADALAAAICCLQHVQGGLFKRGLQ